MTYDLIWLDHLIVYLRRQPDQIACHLLDAVCPQEGKQLPATMQFWLRC